MHGVAPYYSDGDKPKLSIHEININLVERLASEIRQIYTEINQAAVEHNYWAELARHEAITILKDDEDAQQNS